MPTLDFNTLPAGITDSPFTVLDSRLKQLNNETQSREKTLRTRRLPPDDLTRELYTLQDDYSNKVSNLRQLSNSMRQVQLMVNAKQISEDEGNKAMWRMVLPEETSKAMFPTIVKESAIPAAQLTTQVQERARTITRDTKGWGQKEQKDLLPQYKKYRDRVALVYGVENYEGLSPIQKKTNRYGMGYSSTGRRK